MTSIASMLGDRTPVQHLQAGRVYPLQHRAPLAGAHSIGVGRSVYPVAWAGRGITACARTSRRPATDGRWCLSARRRVEDDEVVRGAPHA